MNGSCCPVCDLGPGQNPNPSLGAFFCDECSLFYNGGPDEWLAYEGARERKALLISQLAERMGAPPDPPSLLADVRTGEDLMRRSFTYNDALEDLCHLVDSGACTPLCLFGMEPDGPCVCRCMGIHHGQARHRD